MAKARRAKLFQNGGSQAVRLPKDFRLPGSEVLVRREGERIILEPIRRTWSERFRKAFLTPGETVDFPDRAPQGAFEVREDLDG